MRTGACFAILLVGAVGCGDNYNECGPGTIEQDGVCVIEGDTGIAPTITSITPNDDLVGGGATFTLTGTGFRAAGDTSVVFGDVEANIKIDNETTITGTVPPGTAKHVDVTITNRNGSAKVAFTYVGIYGAQGTGLAGSLFLLDPRDGRALEIGPIKSGNTAFAVTGMEFDTDGTLYATQATRDGSEGPASLLKIDPDTGAATVVGALNDGVAVNYASIGDLTVSGGTLFGWAERGTRVLGDDLVSINKTTGAVTIVGDSGLVTNGNALVTLANGSVMLTGRGAGVRAGVATSGATHTIDTTTGAATLGATLDGPGNAKVCATTAFRGVVYGMLCYSGHTLVRIDPATGAVTRLGSPPGGIDALASAEPTAMAGRSPVQAQPRSFADACDAGTARITAFGTARPDLIASALAARLDLVTVPGRRAHRGVTIGTAVGSIDGATNIEIRSCNGESLVVAAGDADQFVVVANKLGTLKLMARDGQTLLRDVTALRAF